MRIVVAGLALLLSLDLAVTALAQRDAPPPAVDVTVKAGWSGKVVVSLGDMRGQPLTDVLVAAIGFLVNWGRGGPGRAESSVPVVARPEALTTAAAPLVLPASGLQVASQTDLAAFVRVLSCSVRPPAGPALRCPLTLQLTRPDAAAAWHVTGVTVP